MTVEFAPRPLLLLPLSPFCYVALPQWLHPALSRRRPMPCATPGLVWRTPPSFPISHRVAWKRCVDSTVLLPAFLRISEARASPPVDESHISSASWRCPAFLRTSVAKSHPTTPKSVGLHIIHSRGRIQLSRDGTPYPGSLRQESFGHVQVLV